MEQKWKKKYSVVAFIFLEVILLILFLSFLTNGVFAGYGDNVTVITNLTIGNVFPEILNVTINDGDASVALTANDTTTVYCFAHVVDYNGDDDISVVSAELFDNDYSSYGDSDDNNYHYTNPACTLDTGYGDAYTASANCSFDVWYYANASTWNCTVRANDSYNWENRNSSTITVSELLALGLPDIIQYGTVNATYVSNENVTNVTNLGNVQLNLSLNGYGFWENDGNAMNCTLGANKNISIDYEKYNLTDTTPGDLTHVQFIGNYTNLTSAPVTKRFDLDFRHQDGYNEAWNYTYWRVYVPLGVAGSCQGNIIFGAVQDNGI